MKDEMSDSIQTSASDIVRISEIVTNEIISNLTQEAIRWGSIALGVVVFFILALYLVKESKKSKAENVIITYDLSEMREANALAKKEYLMNVEVLKQDLYKQAEEIRENYTNNLEEFKNNLVRELNIDNDVLEAYKEFYKIKSIVFQDIEHQDLSLDAVIPVVYLRLNKTYKRLYDFEKTYGYILPTQIDSALKGLMKHCQNGINNDNIKESKYTSTNTFVNSLENLNNQFRKYLNLK